MDPFFGTVLTITTILLILGLSYAGYLLYYYQSSQDTWPNTGNVCPDTWINNGKNIRSEQKCSLSLNSTNKGIDNFSSIDPNNDKFRKINGIDVYTYDKGVFTFHSHPKCDLKIWAKQNNILWDGITNYNNC
jgi:hypothetical protein